MRIAALYDIHGNLPALEAVLEEVVDADVDLIVFGGDLCFGPLPAETLHLAQSLENTRFVRGNADREVAGEGGEKLDGWIRDVTDWCYAQLPPEDRSFLLAQSTSVTVDVDELGATLFCHGSPRGDEETITIATPEVRLEEMFAGVSERLIVCGHTHAQFERNAAGHHVVNAGSVGLPFGNPGAYWALLGPEIELRRTEYDYRRAGRLFRKKGGPEADGFAEHITMPPPLETAAEMYG